MNAPEQMWQVLLIDDDKEDYIITREMLRDASWRRFHLDWVNTYEEGLSAICGMEYDVALIDYDLGAQTGVDLIRHLNDQGCKVPLVLYTGRGNYQVDVEAMEAGATMYLSKQEVSPLLLERILRYAIDRKQAQDKLAESEANYRVLFDRMLNAFALHEIILDDDGTPIDYRFLDVNPEFEHLTGLKTKDVLGKTVREVLPGIERSWIQIYGQVALTGNAVRFDQFSQPLNRHYEVVAFSPRKGQFATIFTDVTEHIQAMNEVKESQQRYRALAAATFEGILISEEGLVIDMSDQMAQMSGYSHEEVVGKPISIFVIPDEREQVMNNAFAHREGHFEYTGLRKDGSRYPMEVHTKIITYQERTVRVSAIRDVTEERRTIQALRESEERYSSLFNNHHTPMMVIDPDNGQIMEVNAAASSFYGWSKEQMVQMNITEINALGFDQIREKMGQAKSIRSGSMFYFPHRLASGQVRNVEVHSGPIRYGNKEYLFSIIHDHGNAPDKRNTA